MKIKHEQRLMAGKFRVLLNYYSSTKMHFSTWIHGANFLE